MTQNVVSSYKIMTKRVKFPEIVYIRLEAIKTCQKLHPQATF